jgi:hypothetical protein
MVKENRFIGYDIKNWELLEYSIVPIPANQEALRLHLDEMGDNLVVKSLREQLKSNIEEDNRKKEIEELKAEAVAVRLEFGEMQKLLDDTRNEIASVVKTLKEEINTNKKNVAEIVAEKRKQDADRFIAESVRRAVSDINKTK